MKKPGIKDNARERSFIRFTLLKEERAQRVTTLTFTLVALSIFGLFAISPTLSTITKLKKELTDAEFVNEKLKEKIDNLSSLQRQYAVIQNDLVYIINALPQSPRIPSFTGQVQQLAVTNQITLSTLQIFEVSLVAGTQNSDTTSFSFSLSGQGSSLNVIAFLDGFNTMNRITTLDSVTMNTDPLKNTINISIKGKAYFKK